METKLQIMRHSAAHVLAAAVAKLYPQAKFGIGPAIENGFYYDIDFGKTISDEDLIKLEEESKKIIAQDLKFEKQELPRQEAISFFEKANQEYKVDLLNNLEDENVSLYKLGDFIDLCKGPHLNSTKEIGAIKLNKIAGAYWKADINNKQLQRIYGLCFETQVELDKYLADLAEAEKRDHRKLGRELDLFHVDDTVGLGLPLWHPKGAILWRLIEDFWYKEHLKSGYSLVRTPHIGNKKLWEQSGHWGFYNDSMYPPLEVGQSLEASQKGEAVKEQEAYLLKPMNCPFHVQIYKNKPRSYREFPLRWAECGTVYRFEKKGELSGLTRVRGFTQDDAHIICRKDQVEDELKKVIDFILFIYQSFGFSVDSVNVYLSLRDPGSKKYAGTDEGWKFTEEVLEKIAQEKNLNYKKEIGEAAFYGPKLDFKIKDVLGREWQCSTLQFDFNLPERFDLKFVNSLGEEEQPLMLHRALFGSFERFIGLLIEHYAGAFPVWLSPTQVLFAPVSEKHADGAWQFANEFRDLGMRVEVDDASETISNKVRKFAEKKIPYMVIVGDKELSGEDWMIRVRGQKEQIKLSKADFMNLVVNSKQ